MPYPAQHVKTARQTTPIAISNQLIANANRSEFAIAA
jgi:hypothetical protein